MTDITEKLERLAALLDRGLLTRDEFEQQKAALLATTSGPPPSLSDPSIPAQVGAYRILSPIGQGGMGAVYRGRHRSDTIADRQGGDVAIKVMHTQFARNPEFQARFEREASLGLKLDHPGIVKVHDLVVDAGTLALVMELVDGRSLADLIGKEVGPIPWARAWPMVLQLLNAVEYAHGQGVIHRDLKPANVMVGPVGNLKIMDFGVAKEIGARGVTATGTILGTVDYMAPEQHTDAKNVDERADVYALGMTLYEMLAGRLPWGDEVDAVGVLHRKLDEAIPEPTDFYPSIPAQVVAGVMGALTTDRVDRTDGVSTLLASFWSASGNAVSSRLRGQEQRSTVAETGLAAERGMDGGRNTAPGQPGRRRAERTPTPGRRMSVRVLTLVLVGVALVAVSTVRCPPSSKDMSPVTHGARERVDDTTGIELVLVPTGSFSMGSPVTEDGRFAGEEALHRVQIGSPFWMAKYPVTNEQYARFLDANPDHRKPELWSSLVPKEPRCPVVGVSWGDAVAFCEWAGMRLPTEAEWEYACRAGATTRYWSGDSEDDLARVGWYDGNSEQKVHPVGELAANPFGLHDMHGGVWEWCSDWFSADTTGSEIDPTGPPAGKVRVVRGGSVLKPAKWARCACRGEGPPSTTERDFGFRPVLLGDSPE
jgi:formylglycine-generating enzyme required for sulfatase activity